MVEICYITSPATGFYDVSVVLDDVLDENTLFESHSEWLFDSLN